MTGQEPGRLLLDKIDAREQALARQAEQARAQMEDVAARLPYTWARSPVFWVEVGCRARCLLRPFSRTAPSRTRHASFPATGSPVTTP